MSCHTIPAYPCPQPPLVVVAPPAPPTDDSATGSVSTGPVAQQPQAYTYPTLATAALVPGANQLFTLIVVGASTWAAPDMLLWIPELEGYVSIRAVNGDSITVRATSIGPGVTLPQGTRLVPFAPQPSATNTNPESVTSLELISGSSDGTSVNLPGTLGAMLYHDGDKWTRMTASPFIPTPAKPLILTVKRDVIAATPGATRWTNPVFGGTGSNLAPATVTFPLLPTLAVGQQPRALVEVRWKLAAKTGSSTTLKATIGGYEWQRQSYVPSIATVPSAINNTAFVSEVEAKGASGIDQILIPVVVSGSPPESQAMAVAIVARGTANPSGAANTHLVAEFRLLGYFV